MGLFDFLFKAREPKISEVDILRNKLEEVFAAEYNNYELRKDVHISEIKISDEDISYSYGLYSGSVIPKALIMVINNRNDYRTRPFKVAKIIAENEGIVYLNFFSHLPNEMDYISQLLKDNIK